jgi:Tol biopolymer transport system component
VRLGDGNALQSSPDGRWVLALTEDPVHQLVLLPTGAGEPRFLTPDRIWIMNAVWHPDGRRIFFLGRGEGSGPSVHILDIESGETRPFVPEGFVLGMADISPDGRLLVVLARDGQRVLYPVDGGEAIPVPGLGPGDVWVSWSSDSRSIFVSQGSQVPARVFRVDIESGQRERWRDLAPADVTGVVHIGPIRFTPDGAAYVYSYVRFLSDLFMVEGIV